LAYNIVYKKSVQRDLKKIDKQEILHILDQIEKDLSSTPELHPMLKGQFSGLRKYRIGDYRIIYAIIEQDVIVLRIGNRKDIYK
jgi:mRNA interferase RelE/StbE